MDPWDQELQEHRGNQEDQSCQTHRGLPTASRKVFFKLEAPITYYVIYEQLLCIHLFRKGY